jgi:hypothetical protein
MSLRERIRPGLGIIEPCLPFRLDKAMALRVLRTTNAMLKRQRRRLLTRQDALQRGLKRYRGKVCAKHRKLKGEG